MKRISQLSFLRQATDYLRSGDLTAAVLVAMRSRPHFTYHEGGFFRTQYAEDVWKLKVLNSFDDGLHKRINQRAALLKTIQANTVNGMIGIVESGRDCDCVDYVHPCEAIPATIYAYNKLEREKGQWADGPFQLQITTPKEADATPWESHDRVLEAFEDGHPHHVISTFSG